MKGIEVSAESTNEREIVPNGTHVARCYQMIHLGTQEFEYQGELKRSNKIRLTFEIPTEMREYGGEQKPMVISKEYTLSLHEKSNLRKDLESWRGEAFTGTPRFDITDMMGGCCMITITHKVSNAGNKYAAVTGVSKLPAGWDCPDQINESFIFNFYDNFNQDWLNQQPEWIQEQIKNTDEYTSKINQIKHQE